MPEYIKFDSISLLQKGVAEDLCQYISSALKKQQYFTLVLSGGNTPVGIFDYIRENLIEKIQWDRVYVFWLDERAVPFESENSNYGVAYRHLFSLIPNIHLYPIKGWLGAQKASDEYENELCDNKIFEKERIPHFDYIMIGVGIDGHVASLFHDKYNFKEKLVIPTVSPDNVDRISMTPALINAAKRCVILLTGVEKAKVFKQYLRDEASGRGINLITKDMDVFIDNHANKEINC